MFLFRLPGPPAYVSSNPLASSRSLTRLERLGSIPKPNRSHRCPSPLHAVPEPSYACTVAALSALPDLAPHEIVVKVDRVLANIILAHRLIRPLTPELASSRVLREHRIVSGRHLLRAPVREGSRDSPCGRRTFGCARYGNWQS